MTVESEVYDVVEFYDDGCCSGVKDTYRTRGSALKACEEAKQDFEAERDEYTRYEKVFEVDAHPIRGKNVGSLIYAICHEEEGIIGPYFATKSMAQGTIWRIERGIKHPDDPEDYWWGFEKDDLEVREWELKP